MKQQKSRKIMNTVNIYGFINLDHLIQLVPIHILKTQFSHFQLKLFLDNLPV